MIRCSLCESEIKLSEQESKNIPSKYQFPTAFLQSSPSVCSLMPSHREMYRRLALCFCSTFEDFQH